MSTNNDNMIGVKRGTGKAIVVFSDGTGNSSAKLFKTNVWRLYEAVETGAPTKPGQRRQIVAYDDGVGTSTFKPLTLLGGAMGVGLMRNVLDLYRFVCRNYEDGDEIYAFGFSRGAFTIRVLVGLLTGIGIIETRPPGKPAMSELVLEALSEDAYCEFRRAFKLNAKQQPQSQSSTLHRRLRDRLDRIVDWRRNSRDRKIARKRARSGLPTLVRIMDKERIVDPQYIIDVENQIAFVGVWDTVAAYGSPIAEITKGIDQFVWPLSMPDYKLSAKVRRARHVLALDDERDTFHPLLWDEIHEQHLIDTGEVDEQRLRQVWFTGMHSDVGGGYSDDSLAYVSLVWMADEAQHSGLWLRESDLKEFRDKANPFGPLHNSRSGVAAYYRYQPRKIAARLEPPDPTTRIVQDPDFEGHGLLRQVHIHDSVLDRIQNGTDGYAPIVLPETYEVEGGPQREEHPQTRAVAQEWVWDEVWRRRLNYFATLFLTLILVSIGLWPQSASNCIGPLCTISPVLRAVGAWLPAFASRWIDAYAARPTLFVVLAGLVAWLLIRTGRTELGMRDRMRELFRLSMSPTGASKLKERAAEYGFGRRFRTSAKYQTRLQMVKWRVSPGLAAGFIYLVGVAAALAIVLGGITVVNRTALAIAEHSEAFCDEVPDQAGFSTANMCWRVPNVSVVEGKRYQLRLTVTDPWVDGTIVTSPEGFSTTRFGWWAPLAATLPRSMNDPWFRPLVHIANRKWTTWIPGDFVSVPMRMVGYPNGVYVGEFVAPETGSVMLTVNDGVFLPLGGKYFYTRAKNGNEGTADVAITACEDEAVQPPCEY